MTANQAFDILNLVALAGWVLLALSPKLPRVITTMTGAMIPALFAVVYVLLVVSNWNEGDFSSLILTFLFGPAGWLFYVVLRPFSQRRAFAPGGLEVKA